MIIIRVLKVEPAYCASIEAEVETLVYRVPTYWKTQ